MSSYMPTRYATLAPRSIMNKHRNTQSPVLKKPPLPISPEFDSVLAAHAPKDSDSVDRSEWLNKILELHPEIKSLRESVNPICRAAEFGRLYLPSNRYIPHDVTLALISQHFRTLGLTESQAALHNEWGSDFNIPPHKLESQLALLIQRGIYRAEKFWELSIPSIHTPPTPKLTQVALDEAISTIIGASSSVVEDSNPIENEKPYDPAFYITELDTENSEKTENASENTSKEPLEASLNQIIFYVTDPSITNASEVLNALILTIQSLTSSRVFFFKIRDRIRQTLSQLEEVQKNSNRQSSSNLEELSDEDKKNISRAERCVQLSIRLFKAWVKSALQDLEPQIIDMAQQFVDNELMEKYSTHVSNIFERKNSVSPQMTSAKSPQKPPPAVDIGNCPNLWTGGFDLFDLPITELARQLTFWSYTRYYNIKRDELLDGAWEKPRLKYRAPNVIALTQHYNKLTSWVAHTILSEQNFRRRIEKMNKIIQLMKALFSDNNFLDGMGVLGGLGSNAIFRLKYHFSQIAIDRKEYLEKMEVQCSPDKGFLQLRKMQDEAVLNGKPALPYLGILLADLFKYEENVQLWVNGLINCRKIKGLYNFISKILEFKRTNYFYLSIDQVQEKIDNMEIYDPDLLFEMSLDVEKDGALSAADCKDTPLPIQSAK